MVVLKTLLLGLAAFVGFSAVVIVFALIPVYTRGSSTTSSTLASNVTETTASAPNLTTASPSNSTNMSSNQTMTTMSPSNATTTISNQTTTTAGPSQTTTTQLTNTGITIATQSVGIGTTTTVGRAKQQLRSPPVLAPRQQQGRTK